MLATGLALFVDLGNYTQFLYLIGSVFIPLFAVAIADFFVVSKMSWDVTDTAPFRWQPALAWVFGFVAYQLVNPGTVDGWSPFWLDLQQTAVQRPASTGLARRDLHLDHRLDAGRDRSFGRDRDA